MQGTTAEECIKCNNSCSWEFVLVSQAAQVQVKILQAEGSAQLYCCSLTVQVVYVDAFG